jgi:hypothetical protein
MGAINAKAMLDLYSDVANFSPSQREMLTRIIETAYHEGKLDQMQIYIKNFGLYEQTNTIQHQC